MNPKVVQDSSKSYIELKAIIAAIPDEATKKAVQAVVDKMYEHQEENDERFDRQEEFLRKLDDRIREQERYTRKNSVIIDNPPFDARKANNEWLPELLKFLNKLNKLSIEITENRLIAYHILPPPDKLPADIFPSIIVKFVHYGDKDEVYKNRRMLKNIKNHLNSKNIWMKETLPPLDAFVERLARSKNMIAVTNNCKVSVLCKGNRGDNVFVRVNNAGDIDKLRNPIIRAAPQFNSSRYDHCKLNNNQGVKRVSVANKQDRDNAFLSPQEKKQNQNQN